MIDLKYHIYSLVAVFLALGIGILIGVSLALGGGSQEAIKNQSGAIQRLRSEFKNYDDRIASQQASLSNLTQDLKDASALSERIVPQLVQGRLSGRRIAIVQVSPADDLTRQIAGTLGVAGASISSVTQIAADLDFSSNDQMQRAVAKLPPEFQDPTKEAYQLLWGYFATIIASGQPGSPLEGLQTAGILQSPRWYQSDYSAPNRFVVIVAPRDPAPRKALELVVRPLAERLQRAKLTVVIAAAAVDDLLAVSPYTELDLASVTHANTSFGQVALVETLAEGEGQYGFAGPQDLVPRRLLVP